MGNRSSVMHPLREGRLQLPLAEDGRQVEVIGPRTLSISELTLGIIRLAKYRELICTLTLVRLQVRYKQSVLGWIWAVAQPLALMAAYTTIFSKFARVPSQG